MTLSVLISTISIDGHSKLHPDRLPVCRDVSYIIVWQYQATEGAPTLPDGFSRPDIHVIFSDSKGLSASRNIAIDAARSDICLIADDDITFMPGAFKKIIDIFSNDQQLDIALFRIKGKNKKYPEARFRVKKRLPRGYWVTSPEITFRRNSIQKHLKFRENFGLGAAYFTAAEESFWITDAMRQDLTIDIMPIEIVEHPQPSSGEKHFGSDAGFPASQGAYIRYNYGLIKGLPRVLLFSLRSYFNHKGSFTDTLKHALSGFSCKIDEMS